jgi:hypothetical protein
MPRACAGYQFNFVSHDSCLLEDQTFSPRFRKSASTASMPRLSITLKP